METMKDETYNGWKNYPTWDVNLWLSNEPPLYREVLERTSAAIAGSFVMFDHETPEVVARCAVGDMLREWVTNDLAPDLGASFASDLLTWALQHVDWDEIADAWIEMVKENTDA